MSDKTALVPGRGRATGLSLTSWALFATSGPLAKSMMNAGWSPIAVTSARIALAAVLLLPVVVLVRPRALRFRRGDLWLLVGYGLLGVAGVQLFFFLAVARVPVGVAMVLVNVSPVLVALWVRVVRRVRLSPLVWPGIGLALVGLALVAQIWQGARLDAAGVAAGLASAVCSAGYFVLGEHAANTHDALGLTAAGLVIGAVALIAVSPFWTLGSGLYTASAVLGDLRLPSWLALSVLATAGTVLPYLTGLRALRHLSAAPASVLALVEPLVAAVLAWLLLGQPLGGAQLFGAVLLLIGAVLVQRASPQSLPSGRDESPTAA